MRALPRIPTIASFATLVLTFFTDFHSCRFANPLGWGRNKTRSRTEIYSSYHRRHAAQVQIGPDQTLQNSGLVQIPEPQSGSIWTNLDRSGPISPLIHFWTGEMLFASKRRQFTAIKVDQAKSRLAAPTCLPRRSLGVGGSRHLAAPEL
jgi:hypothetical protein